MKRTAIVFSCLGALFLQSGEPLLSEQVGKGVEVHPSVVNLQESFSRIAEAVKPAVVNIATVHVEEVTQSPYDFYFMDPQDLFDQFFNDPHQFPRQQRRSPHPRQRKIPGTGSGVIIDPEGYVLTNEHVVRGADEIKITLGDKVDEKYDGKVIGRDERTDIAVVKIKSNKRFPYVKLGNSDQIKVGDWAIAIGSPFGLQQTVTVGVISASRQNIGIEGRSYKDLIQTDAAINPGNSGGPLVNIRGEVIGVNTAIYTPSGGFAGVGFAIPVNAAKEILPELRAKGKVVRGWIGVMAGKIDEATAKVFGVPEGKGVLVREVYPGFPAAKAGVQRGDVIIEFDGNPIKDIDGLQDAVSHTSPKKKVSIKIIRNKMEMPLDLVTAEAPQSLENLAQGPEGQRPGTGGMKGSMKWNGAEFAELDAPLKQHYSIPPDMQGVLVLRAERGSKAEEIGLAEGDVIRSVNQETVTNSRDLKAAFDKANLKEGLVLDLWRRGESIYLSYMQKSE